jgi:UDP-glucose 4-epimerase
MSNTLVLGGCGFIGSHLVEKLLAKGNRVTVVDNMCVGSKDNLPEHQNLKVINADILDDIEEYFKGVSVVYHLAALTRPQESIDDPEEFTVVNVQGTLQVLRFSKRQKVKRVVFTSSTALYGEQDILPTPETAIPNPMSPYALTKLCGEQYCQLYNKMYGLEYNIIRPFNVYGLRQDPHSGYAAAIPKFIDTLNKKEVPYITGDGKQSRDFIYVGDVVDQMILMATSKVNGEAFNAGSGKSTSINDIYSMVCKLMGTNTLPNHVKAVFEPSQTLGAIDKAEFMLGWKPKVGLEEGLKLTIKETNARCS